MFKENAFERVGVLSSKQANICESFVLRLRSTAEAAFTKTAALSGALSHTLLLHNTDILTQIHELSDHPPKTSSQCCIGFF